jgi:hypothetical protein
MKAPKHSRRHDCVITRRGIFIGAAASVICAPSLVRAARLMPVRNLDIATDQIYPGFCERLRLNCIETALNRGWRIEEDSLTFGGISEDHARNSIANARARGWIKQGDKMQQDATTFRRSCHGGRRRASDHG